MFLFRDLFKRLVNNFTDGRQADSKRSFFWMANNLLEESQIVLTIV